PSPGSRSRRWGAGTTSGPPAGLARGRAMRQSAPPARNFDPNRPLVSAMSPPGRRRLRGLATTVTGAAPVGRSNGSGPTSAADRRPRRAVRARDGGRRPARFLHAPGPGLVARPPRRDRALPRLHTGAVLDHPVDGPDGAGHRTALRLAVPTADRQVPAVRGSGPGV